MPDPAAVLQILRDTDRHLQLIRTARNGIDDAERTAAHDRFAALFRHGMVDAWREQDGKPQPTPDDWNGNVEALEPAPGWGAEATARFYRTLGDLNLLHSNDAGLNAAKDSYAMAIEPLRSIDPPAAVVAIARMLRAAAYASYGADVIEEHEAHLCWSAEVARGLGREVQDEIELSLVEMIERMAGADALGGSIAPALLGALLNLCERHESLPYRRSIPWLVLAQLATSPGATPHLAPFHALLGTTDVAGLVSHALDRAVAVEDGTFYSHGGALDPGEYKKATAEQVARLRKRLPAPGAAATSRHDQLRAEIAALEEHQVTERIELELEDLSFLLAKGDRPTWRKQVGGLCDWILAKRDDLFDLWDMLDLDDKIGGLRATAEKGRAVGVLQKIDELLAARRAS